jgi:hypothetical protein
VCLQRNKFDTANNNVYNPKWTITSLFAAQEIAQKHASRTSYHIIQNCRVSNDVAYSHLYQKSISPNPTKNKSNALLSKILSYVETSKHFNFLTV